MINIKLDGENKIYEVKAELSEKDVEAIGPFFGQMFVGFAEFIAGKDSNDVIQIYDAIIRSIKQGGVEELQEKGHLEEGTTRLTDHLS